MQTHSKTVITAVVIGLAITSSVFADDRVIREYTFDLADITEVEFHGSAGSMDFVQTTGTELKLVLVIKGDDEGWFGSRNKDVDDVELKSRVNNDRLVLEMEEDDTNTEWTVQLPVTAVTTIDLGVGEIAGVFCATELSIELGVGKVDVELPAASSGNIKISVGVGDASLRGAADEEYEKAFVSKDIRGKGEGDNKVNVEVGVGEAKVALN